MRILVHEVQRPARVSVGMVVTFATAKIGASENVTRETNLNPRETTAEKIIARYCRRVTTVTTLAEIEHRQRGRVADTEVGGDGTTAGAFEKPIGV